MRQLVAAASRRRRSSRSSARRKTWGKAAASWSAETSRVNDPWDGTGSRQRRFVEVLRARHPRAELRDLNPILDQMRSIKSAREIALVRRASQITGLGLIEAMRSTEPGVAEYQLDAAAVRLSRQRRAARRLPVDYRERHRKHQQHAF